MAMAADKRKQKAKGKSRVTKKTQAAAKDPGPPYRALWHPEAEAERDASLAAGGEGRDAPRR